MKWFIASDIHGSAYWCEEMLKAYEREKADRLILLGDILYHGPRNDLPREYDPKRVIALLGPYADRILAVRGNCDTEVDQMVLPFPMMAEYAVLPVEGRLLYLTHGHKLDSVPLKLRSGDALLCGHTHVPAAEWRGETRYYNPGSVSIPKNGSRESYMTLEGTLLRWVALQSGECFRVKDLIEP